MGLEAAATMDGNLDNTQRSANAGVAAAPRTVSQLREARESRAADALRMKDEQLTILNTQNQTLLSNLDRVEEDANAIQLEKLAIEEENRTVRDMNFELQSKARAADSQLRKVQAETADKDKQLKIMTDQNSELLRLLETEEAQTAKLAQENEAFRSELETLRGKYGALLTTAKTHEEMASRAAREGQLRAEEVRLLRAETEQLKNQNNELKMKTQVELEALQEQLRVRKEKQYQLLEKLQGQEEAKRQAEDQVAGMEEKLRQLHAKNIEVDTQLQVESRARRTQEEIARKSVGDQNNVLQQNRVLGEKVDKSEQERLRMEAEARDSGEQLREMAEKVFQLLERLKLAELGKTKAMEALQKKEQEMIALQKKNSRLIKESTKEGRSRVKAELDKKVLQDQIRALKKHNAQLSQRCREEVQIKLKELEERKAAEEKVKTLGSRLSFLLNKMQSDEEAKVIRNEETKKMEAQIKTLSERSEELQHAVNRTGDSNRMITQALRLKEQELQEIEIKHEALLKLSEEERQDLGPVGAAGAGADGAGGPGGDGDDVRAKGGRGRFYLESKPALGLILIKGKRPQQRQWLDDHDVNAFLKRAQKGVRFKEMAIERMAMVYGLLMVEEEERVGMEREIEARDKELEHAGRKVGLLQDKLGNEEDAKRRALLRYVNSVKAAAAPVDFQDTVPRGTIALPESAITDEEVHAIAALLRGNTTITELHLRSNAITDEGARAIAAVLAGRTALRFIDLRHNRVSKTGVRAIAEALERSERVRHVYVHAGGKVEALGTGRWADARASGGGGGDSASNSVQEGAGAGGAEGGGAPMVSVETVCVVDVRENTPSAAAYAPMLQDGQAAATSAAAFAPPQDAEATLARTAATSKSGAAASSSASASSSAIRKKKKSEERGKRKEALRIKAEASRMEASREVNKRERNRVSQMEAGWSGQAGGMTIGTGGAESSGAAATSASTSRLPGGGKTAGEGLPPLAAARSAPALHARSATSRPRIADSPLSGPAGPRRGGSPATTTGRARALPQPGGD